MSELKARHIVDVYDDYAINPFGERSQVYLKSEADKVIAEKDKEIQRLENLCESYRIDCDNLAIREANAYKEIGRDNKQIRHQKYKRCLKNSEGCLYKVWYYDEVNYRNGSSRMWKWRRRWLELAEKFKGVSK